METKKKAGNNRTLTLQPEEIAPLKKQLITESNITGSTDIVNKTLNGDIFKMILNKIGSENDKLPEPIPEAKEDKSDNKE